MNNTSVNGTTILYDLYSSTAKIIGYSFAYAIFGSLALFGKYMFLTCSNCHIYFYKPSLIFL